MLQKLLWIASSSLVFERHVRSQGFLADTIRGNLACSIIPGITAVMIISGNLACRSATLGAKAAPASALGSCLVVRVVASRPVVVVFAHL